MTRQPQVTASDRLSFSIFIALALHALFIFGVGLELPVARNDGQLLDVTLVTHVSDSTPEDADFLAQNNQQGSGTTDEAKQITTTQESEFEDNNIRKIEELQQQATLASQQSAQPDSVVTTGKSSQQAIQVEIMEQPVAGDANESIQELVQTYDIATLKAMLSDKRQQYASRPRIRTLTAVSARSAVEAGYILDWLSKVERIGNLNYPVSARQNRLTGEVRLLVSLAPTGAVKRVEIMESSGFGILDDAAKRIALLASPFEPFPPEMRQTFDEVEIIRTWRFVSELSLEF